MGSIARIFALAGLIACAGWACCNDECRTHTRCQTKYHTPEYHCVQHHRLECFVCEPGPPAPYPSGFNGNPPQAELEEELRPVCR